MKPDVPPQLSLLVVNPPLCTHLDKPYDDIHVPFGMERTRLKFFPQPQSSALRCSEPTCLNLIAGSPVTLGGSFF
eukprot:2601238-Pyramimonas_sp.AAC.1